jgi:hypothetical protein
MDTATRIRLFAFSVFVLGFVFAMIAAMLVL